MQMGEDSFSTENMFANPGAWNSAMQATQAPAAAPVNAGSWFDSLNLGDLFATGIKTYGAVETAKAQSQTAQNIARITWNPYLPGHSTPRTVTGGIRNPITGAIEYPGVPNPPLDLGNLPLYAGIAAVVLVGIHFATSGSSNNRSRR